MATLVLVHGAGAQDDRATMEAAVRASLGLPAAVAVCLGYYADILHGPGEDAERALIVERNTDPGVQPSDAAALLLDAVKPAEPVDADPDEAASRRYRALSIARELYDHADLLALRAADAGVEGADVRSLRLLAGWVGFDVYEYLFGVESERMLEAVRAGIACADEPFVVVAHSLGSIIAHDALTLRTSGGPMERFVTIGSPLGMPGIQAFLKGCQNGPCRRPPSVATLDPAWLNGYDRDDIVAGLWDKTFTDEYTPNDRSVDVRVDNTTDGTHELHGYLRAAPVRDAIRSALGL